MKIAVTGGHGFIGSHVVEVALAEGHEVVAVASPWGDVGNLNHLVHDPRLAIRRADVAAPSGLGAAFEECDAIVHAAARVADFGRWELFEAVNVGGTRNVALEAGRLGIARVVLVSSVAIWSYVGIDGDDPRTRPRDRTRPGYGCSKRLAEDVLTELVAEPVLVRPALWPYGRRDPTLSRLVGALCGRRLPLVDGGKARLQTVDARFLARALVASATLPEAAGKSYLVADRGVVTWKGVLSEVAELVGCPRPHLSVPGRAVASIAPIVEDVWRRLGGDREPPLTRYRAELMRTDVVFDASHVESELGLRPERDRRTALRDALSAFAR